MFAGLSISFYLIEQCLRSQTIAKWKDFGMTKDLVDIQNDINYINKRIQENNILTKSDKTMIKNLLSFITLHVIGWRINHPEWLSFPSYLHRLDCPCFPLSVLYDQSHNIPIMYLAYSAVIVLIALMVWLWWYVSSDSERNTSKACFLSFVRAFFHRGG
jgi:hypothetical protein